MAETVSRAALENALVQYAPQDREAAAKTFLGALSVDELLFLGEFLGSCILVTSATNLGTWDAISNRAHACHRAMDRMSPRQREDMEHKLILMSEFAERCGFLIRFR